MKIFQKIRKLNKYFDNLHENKIFVGDLIPKNKKQAIKVIFAIFAIILGLFIFSLILSIFFY